MASDMDLIVERVLIRMDFQDRMLSEIRNQCKETNGRVTALEKFQARVEGASAAMSWRTPLIVGVVCAIAGAVVSHFI